MLGALQNIHLNSSVNLDNFMKLTHILSKFFLTHILSNGDKLAGKSHRETFFDVRTSFRTLSTKNGTRDPEDGFFSTRRYPSSPSSPKSGYEPR